jgi:hypothetical protein
LLYADGDMLFELISPALREVFCVIRKVSGDIHAEGEAYGLFWRVGDIPLFHYFTNPI